MAKSPRDSRRWRLLLLSLALAPVGCGPEYEVLSTPPDKEVPGAAGTGVGTGGSTGGSAEGGNTSTGGVSTGGITSTGGTGIGGTGVAGMGAYSGMAGEGAVGGASSCMAHSDCPTQHTCNGGACTPCGDSEVDCTLACPAQQMRMPKSRNGCAICECVPESECVNDDNCPEGEVCYRGAQCDDNCDGTGFECCDGNYCALPGCSGSAPSCNLSGCEGGAVCQPSCTEATCVCDGMTWICSDTGMSATGGSSGAGGSGVGAIGGNDCQGQCLPP